MRKKNEKKAEPEPEEDNTTQFFEAEEATLQKFGSSKSAAAFAGRRRSLAQMRESITGTIHNVAVVIHETISQTFGLQDKDDDNDDDDMDEHHLVNEMLEELSDEEMEICARASYQYLKNPQETEQLNFAKLYAIRFLRAKQGNVPKATQRLKETLDFRKRKNIDWVRMAFDTKIPDKINFTRSEQEHYASKLEHEISSGTVKVQGYDKDGRSTYIFIPRNVQGHDNEWTIKQHIYTLERAVASSKAKDSTVNAVVDFNGFSLRNAPPTNLGKEFMATFRNHYAGAIHAILLVDAPATFNILWNVFKPLLAQSTREKIHFISTKDTADNPLTQLYNASQAASWMRLDGTLNRAFTADEYLYQTPFNQPFQANSTEEGENDRRDGAATTSATTQQ